MNFRLVMMLLVACSLFTTDVQAKRHGDGNLPPGLAMNKARGKPLPPGWQKKLVKGEKLDDDVFAEAKVISPVTAEGRMTIRVGDTTITLDARTREILSFKL